MGCVFSTPRVDPEPFDDGENANVSGTTEKGYSVSEEAGFPRIKIEEASNVPGAAEKGNSSSEKAGFLGIKNAENFCLWAKYPTGLSADSLSHTPSSTSSLTS